MAASRPSKFFTAMSLSGSADSIKPACASSTQLPPFAALPVKSLDAATSAPVTCASLPTNCAPVSPAATLQPYNKMSPTAESDCPISARSEARLARVVSLSVLVPSCSAPAEPCERM